MILLVLGIVFMLLGTPFLIRGWVFTLKPNAGLTLRAKERNMRLGLETDMGVWGRKVRRMGLLLFLVGAGLAAWGGGLFG